MSSSTQNQIIGVDNLQTSVESWITNLDSLEIYNLDRVLSVVSKANLRNINLQNLYILEPSESISDLIVRRDPTSGEILDYYEDFENLKEKDETLPYNFDENSLELKDLLFELPSIGKGIDYAGKELAGLGLATGEKNMVQALYHPSIPVNMVDLSQALYHTSILDDTLLDISSQSYLDESSLASMSFTANENDRTVLEILNSSENNASDEISEMWNKKKDANESGGSSSTNSSSSSSPLPVNKRKIKKYAIEPDAKSVKSFDEIKSKLAHSWPFELDPFQKQAVYLMENSECVFVAAHTSAGKTVVAEYAIALSFKHKTKVIYTSPIKALSNQKFREFKSQFEDVGLITGDIQIAPEASCLIMTTEILRSMLYKRSETLVDLEWVIFDEVHYMNDAHRGVVWEEVLILLPDHINIVMLSATIPNHVEFAEWVGKIKQRSIYVISTKKRPIPLEHFLYTGNSSKTSNELFLLIDAQENFLAKNYSKAVEVKNERAKAAANKFGPKGVRQISTQAQEKNIYTSLINMLEQKTLLPVVIFTFSRKRCDENIYMLTNLDLNTAAEKSRIHVLVKDWLASLNPDDQNIPQIVHLTESLKRGIAVHHSGILPIMKEIIELLFQMGLIRVLFATETFAMGINMPARTVVFDSVRKHDGTKFRSLQASEYIQMAGRAGRRGLDSTGTVIVLCKNQVFDLTDLQSIMKGKAQLLESKFRITYKMILSLLRKRDMRIQDFMRRSFSEHQMTTAEDPAVYEAASLYLNDKLNALRLKYKQDASASIASCAVCSQERMLTYYNACADYSNLRQELFGKLQVHGAVFKSLQPGRVVFVKSTLKKTVAAGAASSYYKLAPVILLEPVTKDSGFVLALSLDEVNTSSRESSEELWEDEDSMSSKMTSFYDRTDNNLESLVEKLKAFKVNDMQIPFMLSSLATYKNLKNSTLVQIRYDDIQAISTKVFQKNPQLHYDFSFASVWREITNVPSSQMLQRNVNSIQNLNKELSKSTSFVNLSSELLRYTENYTNYDTDNTHSLLTSNLIIDFTKDLNIRDVQFVEICEAYKRVVGKLNKSNCLDCTNFKKHFDEIQIEYSILDRISYLHDVISGNSLLLVSEYRYRVEVLKKQRLIDDKNFVLLKGKVALEISVSELLITELIIENIFSQMNPSEIVSLLSSIVYKQKSNNQDDEKYFKTSFNNATLDQGRDKMIQIALHLNNIQSGCKLQVVGEDDYLELLNFGLVPVVYEWCKGVSFVQITTLTDAQEGIIVRTIQRLDELCNNLKNAARIIGDTVLESKIEQCSVLIKRDIIFAASLYVK